MPDLAQIHPMLVHFPLALAPVLVVVFALFRTAPINATESGVGEAQVPNRNRGCHAEK